MGDAPEQIDEVALNVLLAERLDVPTAVEASRRDGGVESAALGLVVAVVLFVIAILALVVVLW